MKRNHCIDLFRLIASFFIVCLHNDFGNLNPEYTNFIRLGARWAVPFFFMVSGYFLGKKIKANGHYTFRLIEKNIVHIISLLLISNLAYLPINIWTHSLNDNLDLLLTGTFFHLWFLSSLLFGLVVSWYFHAIKQVKVLYALSFFIILLVLFSDSYDLIFRMQVPFDLPQFLLSVPFISLGLLIGRKEKVKASNVILWTLTALGFFLQYGETAFFENSFGLNKLNHVFLIGTILFSISLFLLSTKIDIKDNQLSRWGLKYSLFIYLYHMWALIIIDSLLKRAFPVNILTIQIAYPMIAFVLTLTAAIVLNKFSPWLFSLLNGDFSRLSEKEKKILPVENGETAVVNVATLQTSEK